ncbi:M23 family metallopeptidase [Jeotgalibacillus aurantiacus]|uniref:M23 family metallopeptidase n=1 Tax=Jeotgalibacillus aurantiacus TaxID=2763266 RepID=UPI001D0A6163|nr:M23 family metallopeptidase [Jeotgalibacillus aurantiacus]
MRKSMTGRGLIPINKRPSVKLFAAGIILSSSLTGFGKPAKAEEEGLSIVYHVYAGDEYLGMVEDEQLITDWAEDEEKKLESSKELEVAHNVTMIPEHVFHPETNDRDILNQVKDSADFVTEAKALSLNGHPVAYVKDEKEEQEVIRQLKLSAVSKEELAAYEEKGDSAELKPGESRINSITIEGLEEAEDLSVTPESLSTPEKAAEKLLAGTKAEVEHEVKEGETKEQLLEQYNMKEEAFDQLNPELDELTEGDIVKVQKAIPGLQVKVEKEKRVKETIAFEEQVKEDDTMLKGESRVEQEGQDGEKVYTQIISETNGKEVSSDITDEEVTREVKNHIVVNGTKEIPSKGTGSFIFPTNGGYISSHQGPRWGDYHKGIDIAQPDNYTIKNVDNGVVVSAGPDGDYGNKVVIDHNNGVRTTYAHLAEIHVTPGQVVAQGESLGIMGDTGFSTGIHLHFEVHVNGQLVNPMDYL